MTVAQVNQVKGCRQGHRTYWSCFRQYACRGRFTVVSPLERDQAPSKEGKRQEDVSIFGYQHPRERGTNSPTGRHRGRLSSVLYFFFESTNLLSDAGEDGGVVESKGGEGLAVGCDAVLL